MAGTELRESAQPHGNVLVVDDDPQILESLTEFLQHSGWQVATASSGEEALEKMQQHTLDAVLLDVNLPGMSGFEVLEQSQKAGVIAPIFMISTSTSDENRLRAFGLGAEDYLTKPLEPEVLITRLERFAQGTEPLSETLHQIGMATIDLRANQIRRPGADPQTLPEFQRELLRTLLAHRGQTVSRKQLLKEALKINQDSVWASYTLRALDTMLNEQIEELRRVIEPDARKSVYIKRVFGQGYRLQA